MPKPNVPIAAVAAEVSPRGAKTIYPEPFASRVAGRERRMVHRDGNPYQGSDAR